eukprot:CAMPEP_0181248010 /NCGR_PEP_ID=MMETSP1096-20121128/44932_1 /TAXON_ID=156174 ORGANISM="Chrysochromulina ericina, Strain CCMP281" /NCGR_SAMPLE_ID=MMETSP1096 /ASSEMBLY_ACC=CAM_ASM_000453 /LENGTH=77 /DNA_ID=CAMNT_0023345131 /DNA_START=318 /DNA_END=547 /DNA_ORIENTATION=+
MKGGAVKLASAVRPLSVGPLAHRPPPTIRVGSLPSRHSSESVPPPLRYATKIGISRSAQARLPQQDPAHEDPAHEDP